ncbi:hypothetical protein MKK49_00965 [Methylobacterium sp. J-090]|nr:hypothetical protein [Methylobacterium sp. J-090]MCJ2079848.1 hypothetical protein [Methylobacterium sp. J-090]
MGTKILALTTALVVSLGGAAMAQAPAGGGSATGNMNNPGSVKSSGEKSMERSTGSATGSPGAVPGASGGPSTATTGAPAGSTGGNAVTGSGAAPSGK